MKSCARLGADSLSVICQRLKRSYANIHRLNLRLGGSCARRYSNKAQVGDMGIDGRIYPVGAMPAAVVAELAP